MIDAIMKKMGSLTNNKYVGQSHVPEVNKEVVWNMPSFSISRSDSNISEVHPLAYSKGSFKDPKININKVSHVIDEESDNFFNDMSPETRKKTDKALLRLKTTMNTSRDRTKNRENYR